MIISNFGELLERGWKFNETGDYVRVVGDFELVVYKLIMGWRYGISIHTGKRHIQPISNKYIETPERAMCLAEHYLQRALICAIKELVG